MGITIGYIYKGNIIRFVSKHKFYFYSYITIKIRFECQSEYHSFNNAGIRMASSAGDLPRSHNIYENLFTQLIILKIMP